MSKQEKTVPEIVGVAPTKTARRWNIGSVFWGLLFVLVGVLLLLGNLGLVAINLANIWQLWPVLIIGAGLSLLSLRGWLGGLVSFVAAVALLGLVAFALVDNPIYPNSFGSKAQTTILSDTADQAKKLQITIDTGAADITLSSSRERRGVEARQESNRLRLVKKTETKGDTRHVSFSTESTGGLWLGNVTNNLGVDLTRSLPVALNINTGATNVRGDLSQVRLTSLDIDTGASSVDLRLGVLERRQEISLDAGASSITLYIPKQAGVRRVDSNNGLTNKEFRGLDKVSDSRYESSGFDDAEKQIIIRTNLGVTDFQIKRY